MSHAARTSRSNAIVGGRFVIRACIVNVRTEEEDIESLLNVMYMIGGRPDTQLEADSGAGPGSQPGGLPRP